MDRPEQQQEPMANHHQQTRYSDTDTTTKNHSQVQLESQDTQSHRRSNTPSKSRGQRVAQIRQGTRTAEDDRQSSTGTSNRQKKDTIRSIDKHKQSDTKEKPLPRDIPSTPGELQERIHMDTSENRERGTSDLRHSELGEYSRSDNQSTNTDGRILGTQQTTTTMDIQDGNPNQQTSNRKRQRSTTREDGSPSKQRRERTSSAETETRGTEQDIHQQSQETEETTSRGTHVERRGGEPTTSRPSFRDRPDRGYYTFIIHKTNLNIAWDQLLQCKNNKQSPTFIAFDHGDDIHILYATSPTGGNAAKRRDRILKFIYASRAGIAEAISSFSRVRLLRNYILYCIRYGIETYHKFGTGGQEELGDILEHYEELFGEENPDRVIQDSLCRIYTEQKKAAAAATNAEDEDIESVYSSASKMARMGKEKKKNATIVIDSLIQEYKITSLPDWNKKIDVTTKQQLMMEYGLQYVNYVNHLLKIRKDAIQGEKCNTTLSEEMVTLLKTEVADPQKIIEGIEWLEYMFKENEIDLIEFMAWNEIIKTKRYMKINSLVLEGYTNAGKTLVVHSLIRTTIEPEYIPRERDNSGFQFDQLPNANAALFEEPIITPNTVGTWKLLLEGNTIKTDIKNKDKEPIKRLPIWITTASSISSHVDSNETLQLEQRLKRFTFKKCIDHRPDSAGRDTELVRRNIRKPSTYITNQHWAYLWMSKWTEIYQRILYEDKFHTKNLDKEVPPVIFTDDKIQEYTTWQRNVVTNLNQWKQILHQPKNPEQPKEQEATETKTSESRMDMDPTSPK